MKLLWCPECSSLFNLTKTEKTCSCGKIGGRYLEDNAHAEYWGDAVPVGIDNTDFLRAIAQQEVLDQQNYDYGVPFAAFVIPATAPRLKKQAPPSSAK